MLKSNYKIVLLLTVLLSTSFAIGQNYNPFNQRDDKYRLLGLKRAKEAYEVARAEYDRQKELFSRDLISQIELDRARSIFSDAEVNYQQSLLAVLFEEQYISVTKAVKYQAGDGKKHVKVTLANTSGGSAEFRKLVDFEDELFRSLQPDVIHNVYISISNSTGAIVSQPYEAKLEELHFGQPKTVDFVLLQDLDAVTINLIYSNGTQRSMTVFLQKDATVDKVIVQSEQFSQEVDLGKTSSFDLTLELFSGSSNTFSLEVVNLPKQISRTFRGRAGQVRLSQLKFTESSQTKNASLEISMPDRPTDEIIMDKPIPFYALVIPRDQLLTINDFHTKQWTEEEIKALDVGYVRLELIPRGKGELLVRAPLLFHSILPGEKAEMEIDLFNEGSDRIDNIELELDMPLGWSKIIEPGNVPNLEIAKEHRVKLTFIPPNDVSAGKYDIRIRSTGMSNNQPVNGTDKNVTIEIRNEANLFGTMLIVLLLIGVIGGMVVFGIKLSRR